LVVALSAAACGDDPQPVAPTPAPSFVRLDIDGPTLHHLESPGETVQLHAVASFSDGTRPDVTGEANWSVVDPGVLSVARGLVTGRADGGTIVTATYRGWSSVTNVQVGRVGLFARFPVTGVVREAESGQPVVGATVRVGSGEGERTAAVTDGNGFFSLGDVGGFYVFVVERFGYESAPVTLQNVREPTHLDVRLPPNPGAAIERTASGRFDPPAPGFDESRTTIRLNTRAGGIFDAILQSPACSGAPSLRVHAESGGVGFSGDWGDCRGARLRFVVPAAEVSLTLVGIRATEWVLTYREPR
jgi:hypothetical protein